MISGIILTVTACGGLAHDATSTRPEPPPVHDQLHNYSNGKRLASRPATEFEPAVLLDDCQKPTPSLPENSSETEPVPPCDFVPLPLGQEAAKLPPLPTGESDPAVGNEAVGDFCPLPVPQHAETAVEPTEPPDGQPRTRTVVRLVPVQRRRIVVESVPHWVLTQTTRRTPHGRVISRRTWIRVMLPVRREVVQTTWERRIEQRSIEQRPVAPPVRLRTILVRRQSSRPQPRPASTILGFFSRLWTAKP